MSERMVTGKPSRHCLALLFVLCPCMRPVPVQSESSVMLAWTSRTRRTAESCLQPFIDQRALRLPGADE